MAIEKLAASKIGKLPIGKHCDGRGLWVFVGKNSRSWVFRYRFAGRDREMGIGSCDVVTIDEARARARQYRAMLSRPAELGGPVDPLAERQDAEIRAKMSSANSVTFAQCAEAYCAAQASSWGNPKHSRQWLASLEQHVFPAIGDVPAHLVTTDMIVKALSPIWRTHAVTASRVRTRIERALDWAVAAKLRDDNPAKQSVLKILLGTPVHEVKHRAALGVDEIHEFMAQLRARQTVAARCFEFSVLTATRSQEAMGTRWDEIDGDLWTCPSVRMKGKLGKRVPHIVPLSRQALAVLAQMPRCSNLVFPGVQHNRPLGKNSLLYERTLMGYREQMSPHGCRSTFKAFCRDKAGAAEELSELALAHVIGNNTTQAYGRTTAVERRRALMQSWANYIDGVSGDNVVQLSA
jgi:integrase